MPAAAGEHEFRDLLARIAVAIWAGGTLLLLMRRYTATRVWWRLVRQSRVPENSPAAALHQAVWQEAGCHPRAELRFSDDIEVPVVGGIWRPVILLPSAAAWWPAPELRAALRHELAHVQRRDVLTRLLGQLACALHWPNPLVWLAARAQRVAQEQACDDLVLRAGISASEYAQQLLTLARQISGVQELAAVAMAQPGSLELRLRALVSAETSRNLASGMARSITLCSMLGVLGTLGGLRAGAQLPAPPTAAAGAPATIAPPAAAPADAKGGANAPARKLAEQIIIPVVGLREATLEDALDFLRRQVRTLAPAGQRMDILVRGQAPMPGAKITLSLLEVPLSEALNYIASLMGLQVRYEGDQALLEIAPPEDAAR